MANKLHQKVTFNLIRRYSTIIIYCYFLSSIVAPLFRYYTGMKTLVAGYKVIATSNIDHNAPLLLPIEVLSRTVSI